MGIGINNKLIYCYNMARIVIRTNLTGQKRSPRTTRPIWSGFRETLVVPVFEANPLTKDQGQEQAGSTQVSDPTLWPEALGSGVMLSTPFGPKTQYNTILANDYESILREEEGGESWFLAVIKRPRLEEL